MPKKPIWGEEEEELFWGFEEKVKRGGREQKGHRQERDRRGKKIDKNFLSSFLTIAALELILSALSTKPYLAVISLGSVGGCVMFCFFRFFGKGRKREERRGNERKK